MSILKILRQIFLTNNDRHGNTPSRRTRGTSKDKHIIVTQNGRQKRYRINKYGEVYEEQ